jgi:hypothetical protein
MMPWDYFAKHKNPKAAEPLMRFCKFQQIKKMCVQNSMGAWAGFDESINCQPRQSSRLTGRGYW